MLVNQKKTEKYQYKISTAGPQNADKVIRVEITASRKSAGVRPA